MDLKNKGQENNGEESKSGDGEQSPEQPLDYLRRDLYARNESEELTKRREELKQLGVEREVTQTLNPDESAVKLRYDDVAAQRRRKWLKIARWVGAGALALFFLAVAVWGTLWYRGTRNVTEKQMMVVWQGPADVTAGATVEYTIAYGNNSRVDWENVALKITLPTGFRLAETSQELTSQGSMQELVVGALKSGEEGEFTFSGQLIGEENASVVLGAEMTLTPANFPSGKFSKTEALAVTITAMPFDVAVKASPESATGERVLAEVTVRSLGENSLDGAYLLLDPAAGLELAVEDLEFSAGFNAAESRWELPRLEPLTPVTRNLVMFAKGDPGQERTLRVVVGVREGEVEFEQRSVVHVLKLTATELLVEQAFNNEKDSTVVSASGSVSGRVNFRNTGTVGLSDVILKTTITGGGFDPASLKLPAGAYDPTTQTITWTAATVPELELLNPLDQGSVDFTFEVKPLADLAEAQNNGEDISIVSTTTIDSPDIPTPAGQEKKVVTNRYVMAVGTDLTVGADAFYDDGRLGIESSGPVPPKVGEETTYTVRVRVGSTLNDTGLATVTATLPDGVRYTGEMYKTTGEIEFNDRTGELIWTAPLVLAGTGVTKPAEEFHFQVAIVPGENQIGNEIVFLNRLEGTGTDQKTDEEVTVTVRQFPDTGTARPEEGEVVP